MVPFYAIYHCTNDIGIDLFPLYFYLCQWHHKKSNTKKLEISLFEKVFSVNVYSDWRTNDGLIVITRHMNYRYWPQLLLEIYTISILTTNSFLSFNNLFYVNDWQHWWTMPVYRGSILFLSNFGNISSFKYYIELFFCLHLVYFFPLQNSECHFTQIWALWYCKTSMIS